jgi:hypothetical protein
MYVCVDSLVRQWQNELWNHCWINQGVVDTVLFANNHAIIATTWPSSDSMCLIHCIITQIEISALKQKSLQLKEMTTLEQI